MDRPQTRPPWRHRRVLPGGALAIVVVGWWLLLGAVIVWLMPEPVASATPTPRAGVAEQTMRIHQPGMRSWPVPVDRAAFDAYQRGARESDHDAIEQGFTGAEWLDASHSQLVRIVAADGEVVQVELLEGPYEGRRAWLKARHLSPVGGGGVGG